MLDTIISNLPIPSWILVVLLGIWILWQIFNFIRDTRQTNKDFTNLSATIKSLEELMRKIKNDLKFIANYLSSKSDGEFDRTQLETCSPLKLTEIGREFLETIGFITIFGEHRNDFFQIIDSTTPTTNYDVDIGARKSFIILSERDYFKPIKVYLYNNPEKQLDSIATTAGVYIRDKYLKEHPEITQ